METVEKKNSPERLDPASPRLRLAVPAVLAIAAALFALRPGASGRALAAPAPPSPHPPLTRRVVLVVLDAWRRADALDATRMPTVARLARGGVLGPMETGVRTFTKPCFAEMLTGGGSTLRDSLLNLARNPAPAESIFGRARAGGAGMRLIDATSDFVDLFSREIPTDAIVRVDPGAPSPDPDDVFNDQGIESAVLEALARPSLRLVAAHLQSVDHAGHLFGAAGPRYAAAVASADRRVGRIAARMDLANETLVLVGDHGADLSGHHGGPESAARETAYLAAGSGIRARPAGLLPSTAIAGLVTGLLGDCPPSAAPPGGADALLALNDTARVRTASICPCRSGAPARSRPGLAAAGAALVLAGIAGSSAPRPR